MLLQLAVKEGIHPYSIQGFKVLSLIQELVSPHVLQHCIVYFHFYFSSVSLLVGFNLPHQGDPRQPVDGYGS